MVVGALLLTTTASAQSAYVAADVGADVARISHSDSAFASGSRSGSEVFSWDLRVGTLIGSGWGVELGYVRSLTDKSNPPFAIPLATLTAAELDERIIDAQEDISLAKSDSEMTRAVAALDHLKRMRSLYAARRAALAGALDRVFGASLGVELRAGGMHLLARPAADRTSLPSVPSLYLARCSLFVGFMPSLG